MRAQLNNSFTDEERAMFRTMRLCILSPMMHVENRWVQSMLNATSYAWSQGLQVEEMGVMERAVVHWARNELVRAAMPLESFDGRPYTHFLWLDTDHIFNKDLFCQLARHYMLPEVDIISALYFGRNPPYLPIAYVKDGNPSPYTHYPLIQVPNTLCEVDAIGFGAVITKRECFEKVPDPWFAMQGRGGEAIGEDMCFCVHAKEAGFRIFLDGQYKLGHFGDKQIITEKLHKQYVEEHPDDFGDKIKVELGGRIIHNASNQ